MNSNTSTFDVSDVPLATRLLPEIPYYEAINSLLSSSFYNKKRRLQQSISMGGRLGDVRPAAAQEQMKRFIQKAEQQLAVLEANEQVTTRTIEACSRYHGRLVADVVAHPVLAAVHRAFTQHRPLCLSPDMIWLLVCQGVASHINVHAETLRPKLVCHAGKAEISIRRDDFVKGSPENPWGEVINEFSTQIRGNLGATHALFLPRFSTTGTAERIASEIVLLSAMQSYFEYSVSTMCGIPAITLEGTVTDWEQLASRVQEFVKFDLDWWLKPLQPVLNELTAAASGNVRRAFWESIYKFRSVSGGGQVTGWISAFFPYLKDENGNATVKNAWLAKGGAIVKRLLDADWLQGSDDSTKISPGDFPGGLARTPFIWRYLDRTLEMEFLGGFVGVAQDSATFALRPEIGWAVRAR
jgi:hypothetical protein